MKRRYLIHRVYGIVGSIALLAAGMFMASDARASCGDYLVLRDSDLAAADASMMPSGHDADSHHRPRPCNGPECSRRPVVPSAPVVLVSVERDHGWLLVFVFALENTRPCWGTPSEASLPDPIGADIFHPPRRPRV